MVCTVGVCPGIEIAGFLDLLMIVGTPAEAQAEGIIRSLRGVVDMADGDRHTGAAEAQVTTGPDQAAGKIVDMSGTRTAGTVGGVVPVAFQTAGIAVIERQHGPQMGGVNAVVDGIEFLPIIAGTVFYAVGGLEHETGVHTCLILGFCNVGDEIGVIPVFVYIAVIFDDSIVGWLILP